LSRNGWDEREADDLSAPRLSINAPIPASPGQFVPPVPYSRRHTDARPPPSVPASVASGWVSEEAGQEFYCTGHPEAVFCAPVLTATRPLRSGARKQPLGGAKRRLWLGAANSGPASQNQASDIAGHRRPDHRQPVTEAARPVGLAEVAPGEHCGQHCGLGRPRRPALQQQFGGGDEAGLAGAVRR
jgi:hypothetical protein